MFVDCRRGWLTRLVGALATGMTTRYTAPGMQTRETAGSRQVLDANRCCRVAGLARQGKGAGDKGKSWELGRDSFNDSGRFLRKCPGSEQ